MDEHTWTVFLRRYTVTPNILEYQNLSVGGSVESPRYAAFCDPAAAHEILRLAQREADLLAELRCVQGQASDALSALAVTQPPAADAVRVLAIRAQELYDQTLRPDAWRDARIASLESDLTAAKRANEILGGKVNRLEDELRSTRASFDEVARRLVEKEHQLALAKAAFQQSEAISESRGKRLAELRRTLDGEESRGRAYCLELAEKAGRIRELEEALAGELMENHALKMTVEESSEIEAELAEALALGHGEDLKPCKPPCPGHLGPKASAAVEQAAGAWRIANEENDRHIARITALEAAVEDGIAHVERARQPLADFHSQQLIVDGWNDRMTRAALEQLDLAHEVLSGAVAGVGGHDGRLLRLSERTDAINASSLAEVRGRLVRLEIFRGAVEGRTTDTENHLADLQRRVIALESDLGKLGAATNPAGKPPTCARLDWLEQTRANHAFTLSNHGGRLRAIENRIAALEAGKE